MMIKVGERLHEKVKSQKFLSLPAGQAGQKSKKSNK